VASRPVCIPRYDFQSHTRWPAGEPWVPKPIILVDGLWLLHFEALRARFALSIFLDCAECVRAQRRFDRDVAERGRSAASVRRQFREHVVPMHQRYVQPQIRWADLVISTTPDNAAIDQLAERIRKVTSLRNPNHASDSPRKAVDSSQNIAKLGAPKIQAAPYSGRVLGRAQSQRPRVP
jgi:uridine kinase